MKYCSIDIETTGLDAETCQILQVGAVIEDTNNILPIKDLPKFSCIVEHPEYTGSAFAINMNSWIFGILAQLDIATKEQRSILRAEHHIMPPSLVTKALYEWLIANGITPTEGSRTGQIRITVAGKNFGTFDKKFLEKLPGWSAHIQVNQRILDPSVAFIDWKNDDVIPNLTKCMNRAGISGEVTHNAVQDAIDVINVIRSVTNNYEKNLYQ